MAVLQPRYSKVYILLVPANFDGCDYKLHDAVKQRHSFSEKSEEHGAMKGHVMAAKRGRQLEHPKTSQGCCC